MPLDLLAFTMDAHDPRVVGRFWAGVLGWEQVAEAADSVTLGPADGTGFLLHLQAGPDPKRVPNRMHPDLTSTSLADQRATVERALSLGGRHLDVGQGADADHVVLADPEGNELCVIEPGNRFLAGCGRLGALAGDGTRAAGLFWSEALGWPLVWDQDEETAVQSPAGGTKITWGGPPLEPKPAKNRVHLDLVPSAGSDTGTEVERLLALGATRLDIGQGDVGHVVLGDPDGNELCVLSPDGPEIGVGR